MNIFLHFINMFFGGISGVITIISIIGLIVSYIILKKIKEESQNDEKYLERRKELINEQKRAEQEEDNFRSEIILKEFDL